MIDKGMRPWLWLALAVGASVISWSYMHRILLPWELSVNVIHGRLKAQMGDLYPRWIGTRELLLNKRDPYGPEVSHEIQIGFYGHPVEQNYDKPASEILDEQRFVYPVYVVLLLAPTVHIVFERIQDWAPVLFAAMTALSVWLWIAVLRWQPPRGVVLAITLFVLASPQIAQGLRLRQFGLVVAFLIALASWCFTREHYLIGGILLALSTIKPQMALLCIVWFLLWSLGDWKRRWTLLAGFAGALGLLVGAGELLVSGWPREFIAGLEAYRRYFPTTSPLRLVLGDWLGGSISVLLVIVLLAYAWRNRAISPKSPEFDETLALFFVATCLILPILTPYNHVLLLLPTVMLIRDWGRLPRTGRFAFTAVVVWPWFTSLILLVHPPALDSSTRMPLLPASAALVFPFLLSGLMFVRLQPAD